MNPSDLQPYISYTVGNYNAALMKQIEGKGNRVRNMALFSASTALLFPGGPRFSDSIGAAIYATRLSCLIPIPLFVIQATSTHLALSPDLLINPESLRDHHDKFERKRIIYTITTRGENLTTLKRTFDSTKYWLDRIKEDHKLGFRSEIWIVTEEVSYEKKKHFFQRLHEEGAVVIVVPEGYETPNHACFKARALNYACDIRIEKGIDTPDDWVYHQDTETMVGEDTILGSLDFITEPSDRWLIGAGVILYTQDWKYRYNSVEETTRSVGDIGAMGQMKAWGTVPFGYHGSHLLVRADVENEIGWDYGRVRSEDLLFSVKLREMYGSVTQRLKGFAYEKPPFTLGDQLKQRRRWILGSVEVLRRRDVTLKHKLPIIYSLSSWMSALPSIVTSMLGIFYSTGGLLPYVGGFILGFMWWNIYSAYKVGLEIHETYINRAEPNKRLKMICGATFGMLFDAVAPWYALLNRTSNYEEIRKDDPEGVPLDHIVVDVENYTKHRGD